MSDYLVLFQAAAQAVATPTPTPVAPTTLPVWALWFSFVVSIVVAIVGLSKLRPSSLTVRLTREAFFRLLATGENVFANAVLHARNGSVFVETAVLEVQKLDGSRKNFPLNIVNVGEKVRANGVVMAEHFFYSSSPLESIPADTPKRVLYRGEFRDYATSAQGTWNEFEKWLAGYKTEHSLGFGPIPDKEEGGRIIKDIEPVVKEHVGKLMSGVQLEGGEYKLTLRVGYYDPSYPFRWRREALSSITFQIGLDYKERLRQQAVNTLMAWSVASIAATPTQVAWPEYQPLAVVEL